LDKTVRKLGVSQPKLLFVLDNLGQAMYLGSRSPGVVKLSSDTKEEPSQFADTPLQNRLLKTLEFYKNVCGKDRVRVLATARNEPGELEKLELEKHLQLWQRFHGTFRNIVDNLVKAKNRDVALTGQTFQHSLKGTWKKRYDNPIQADPVAKYIYEAVDLLRQMGIVLDEITIFQNPTIDRVDQR
jgi:mRNA-degrading endonuclease YafQ of YafQ-DinJ toxin-antitoxin module